MTDLLSMTLSELEEYLVANGEKKFRAKQLYQWMMKGEDIDKMSNIPKSLVDFIKKEKNYYIPQIEKKLVSAIDGTVKYLFRMCDGQMIESVVMDIPFAFPVSADAEWVVNFALPSLREKLEIFLPERFCHRSLRLKRILELGYPMLL